MDGKNWLKTNNELDALENAENWEEVCMYLANSGYVHSEDIGVYLRCLTSNWYALSETDIPDDLFKRFLKLFSSAVCHGRQSFFDDYRFMTLFGYMISVSPYLFSEQFDASLILWKANEVSKHNLFVRMLYTGSIGTVLAQSEYEKTKKLFLLSDDNWIIGESAFECYLREILATPIL